MKSKSKTLLSKIVLCKTYTKKRKIDAGLCMWYACILCVKYTYYVLHSQFQ